MLPYLRSIIFIVFALPAIGNACGFAYISSCATSVSLKVNNNPIKQYTTANCSYLPQINGANLGVVNQLSIENAVTLSWQSCVNNVLNGKLYYRVYRENTTTPGAFSELPLTILTTNVSGAYTNKQFSLAAGASVDLLNGLLPDQEYKLELYLKNEVDLDQDNISDSLLIENNVGNNFKASFRTKPSAGPVMVSFPQKIMVTCPGEANGQATAAATGSVAPYTYLWSNGNQTSTISNVTAGTYTVTITSASGGQGSGSVTISQPPPIDISFATSNVTSYGTNNGTISANPSGGTPYYTFLWNTGATTNAISNLVAGTYSLTVTDNNGCANAKSATISVSGGTSPQNYCTSFSGAPWNEYIKNITLGTLNNTSGKTVYSDFTSLAPVSLTIGQSYSMSISTGLTYYTNLESFRVWIDLNRDGIFQATEAVLTQDYTPPGVGVPQIIINQNIIIPSDALTGSTRMRISIKRDGAPTPCEQFVYGEVEDYTVNIIAGGGQTCQTTVAISNILCNNNGTTSNTADDTYTFTMDVAGTGTSWNTTINGSSIIGNYGTPKAMGPYPINGGTLNFTLVNATNVTCTKAVTVTPPSACSSGEVPNIPPTYCPSVSANPWDDYIKKVEIGTISKLSSKTPYSNFTNLSTNLTIGQTVPMAVTSGFSYMYRNEYIRAWIDFNRNGNFEPSEVVFSAQMTSLKGAKEFISTGYVTIPAGTTTGATRIRVISQPQIFPNGCDATIPFGEVEDYTVNLVTSANLISNTENNHHQATTAATAENLLVFPNPVSAHELNVHLGDFMDLPVELELVQTTGRSIATYIIDKVVQEYYTFDATHLPNGFLLIIVKSPTFRTQTKSVVVCRE